MVSLPPVPGEERLVFLSCRKTSAAQRDELAVGSEASEPALEEDCLLPEQNIGMCEYTCYRSWLYICAGSSAYNLMPMVMMHLIAMVTNICVSVVM